MFIQVFEKVAQRYSTLNALDALHPHGLCIYLHKCPSRKSVSHKYELGKKIIIFKASYTILDSSVAKDALVISISQTTKLQNKENTTFLALLKLSFALDKTDQNDL